MSDDEELFEDLYGDDEVVEKKDEILKEEVSKEEQTESKEQTNIELQDEKPQEQETKEGETSSLPQENATNNTPPPPPTSAIPTDANSGQQYGMVPPQMPFDPAQYQQMMASAQVATTQAGAVPPPPPPPQQVPGQVPAAHSAPSTSSAKVFLGGLDWQTTEEKLVDHFSKYGEIVDYTIMKDNATGRSRGFGFLTFKDTSSVDALLKERHILDGKLIDPKRAISKEDQEKVGKIFIGGIDPMVTEQEFDEFFSQFGKIIDCQLMIDKDTGRSRGFGFITYDTPAAVDRVCVNKYLTLKGKAMEVKRAAPRGQHNQQVAAQQAAAQQAHAVAAASHQGVPMYPYGGAPAAAGGVPGAGGVPPTAGYPMMNQATMNQDYMRYYQWYMYQQAAQAAQGGAGANAGGASGSPEGGIPGMAAPLNPQQQAAADDDDQEKSPERPNIPTGPKRAPPLGPSYRGRGRGGYRRGRGGYHPYSRGGGRRY